MSSSQNIYNTPRHGRIPSRSGVQPISPPQAQPSPAVSNHRAPPTVIHNREVPPNALQRWNGASVNSFMRWAYTVRDPQGHTRPNYNYDPDMDNAIYLSETIDDFDANPSLIHELVLRIANPDLGHPSMDWIRANRSLVDILLYRHYQRHGGLILPPLQAAVDAMAEHERAVAAARAAGVPPEQWPHSVFPSFGPPPGDAPGNGKGRGPSGGAPGGNRFGSIGDRRPFGEGRGGGAGTAV